MSTSAVASTYPPWIRVSTGVFSTKPVARYFEDTRDIVDSLASSNTALMSDSDLAEKYLTYRLLEGLTREAKDEKTKSGGETVQNTVWTPQTLNALTGLRNYIAFDGFKPNKDFNPNAFLKELKNLEDQILDEAAIQDPVSKQDSGEVSSENRVTRGKLPSTEDFQRALTAWEAQSSAQGRTEPDVATGTGRLIVDMSESFEPVNKLPDLKAVTHSLWNLRGYIRDAQSALKTEETLTGKGKRKASELEQGMGQGTSSSQLSSHDLQEKAEGKIKEAYSKVMRGLGTAQKARYGSRHKLMADREEAAMMAEQLKMVPFPEHLKEWLSRDDNANDLLSYDMYFRRFGHHREVWEENKEQFEAIMNYIAARWNDRDGTEDMWALQCTHAAITTIQTDNDNHWTLPGENPEREETTEPEKRKKPEPPLEVWRQEWDDVDRSKRARKV